MGIVSGKPFNRFKSETNLFCFLPIKCKFTCDVDLILTIEKFLIIFWKLPSKYSIPYESALLKKANLTNKSMADPVSTSFKDGLVRLHERQDAIFRLNDSLIYSNDKNQKYLNLPTINF